MNQKNPFLKPIYTHIICVDLIHMDLNVCRDLVLIINKKSGKPFTPI